MGGVTGNPDSGILTDDTVFGNQNPLGVTTYKFRKSAGNWVSWTGFNEIRLYDPVTQTLIATAPLPALGTSGSNLPYFLNFISAKIYGWK